MPTEVKEGMLSVEAKSLQLYNEFIKKRFLDRTKKLSDTIQRNNIKTCQSIKAVKPSPTTSKKKESVRLPQDIEFWKLPKLEDRAQKNYSDMISFQQAACLMKMF